MGCQIDEKISTIKLYVDIFADIYIQITKFRAWIYAPPPPLNER